MNAKIEAAIVIAIVAAGCATVIGAAYAAEAIVTCDVECRMLLLFLPIGVYAIPAYITAQWLDHKAEHREQATTCSGSRDSRNHAPARQQEQPR